MSGIKEIAELAQVSRGTVSLVLNGKGDQYRISSATQEKIWNTARLLNYQPNISARRLRSSGESVLPIIALFWSLDTRAVLINRFLKGLQQSLRSNGQEYEVLIQPYVGNQLHEVRSLLTGTRFNGAIIANPTEKDERYLKEVNPLVPLVMYQRESDKYASVNVDSYASGEQVARLFASRGHRRAGIIIPHVSSRAIHLRRLGFIDKGRELGLELEPRLQVREDFSEQGGYQAIRRILQEREQWPTAIFAISDQMSVGALKALHEAGICVPDDIELVGHDDDEVTRYTVPSLTTVHLPVEQMAEACFGLLTEMMQHRLQEPVSRIFDTHLVFRQSCGPFHNEFRDA